MAEAADGSIYAAGLGGAVAKKAQSATQNGGATVTDAPTITTSITVTGEAAVTGDIKAPDPGKQPQAAVNVAATAASPAVDVAGLEKSAIYQIRPDNTVETIWSSKEEKRLRYPCRSRGFALRDGHRPHLSFRRRAPAHADRSNR